MAIIVIAIVALADSKKGQEKQTAIRRNKADERRQKARLWAWEGGEAELKARRHSEEAKRRREQAEEFEGRAARIDPETRR